MKHSIWRRWVPTLRLISSCCCFAYSRYFIFLSLLSKSDFFLTVANEPSHIKGRNCKLEILLWVKWSEQKWQARMHFNEAFSCINSFQINWHTQLTKQQRKWETTQSEFEASGHDQSHNKLCVLFRSNPFGNFSTSNWFLASLVEGSQRNLRGAIPSRRLVSYLFGEFHQQYCSCFR